MHIMVVPSWYSSPSNKVHGSFFKEQFKALSASSENITVAYNEILPLTRILGYRQKRGLNVAIEDGLITYRYRDFNYLPKNSNMFRIFNKRMEKLYLKIVDQQGTVDVIHAHSAFWGGISAAYVAKKYNIPFVLTEHSSLINSKYVKNSYVKWIKNAYDLADKLIVVGNGLKEEISNYTNNDICVIHNLIDFKLFTPGNKSKRNNGIQLFSLAFLVEGKGMDRLIRAFNDGVKGKEVFLNIGGEGPIKKDLENLTKELGLEKQINFLGALNREEVVLNMNDCDGFVLASEHETFGMVYVEALAMGKPILGTKNGGAEDIINKNNGILIENKDHEALVKGIHDFVRVLPEFNSKKIICDCISNYSEEVITSKIKKIYQEVRR